MKRWVRVVVAGSFALAGWGLVGCGGDGDDGSPTASSTTSGGEQPAPSDPSPGVESDSEADDIAAARAGLDRLVRGGDGVVVAGQFDDCPLPMATTVTAVEQALGVPLDTSDPGSGESFDSADGLPAGLQCTATGPGDTLVSLVVDDAGSQDRRAELGIAYPGIDLEFEPPADRDGGTSLGYCIGDEDVVGCGVDWVAEDPVLGVALIVQGVSVTAEQVGEALSAALPEILATLAEV